MPRAVIDWVRDGPKSKRDVPKLVMQFNMADQASRAEYEREIGAILWKALELDYSTRK